VGIISTHIHAATKEFVEGIRKSLERMAGGLEAEARFLKPIPIEDVIADMDDNGIEKSVLLPLDLRTTGYGYVPNDHIADLQRRFPDRFIGFACVDPHMGTEAIAELERSVKELGLKGLGELDGTKQNFCPSDREFYPLYETCVHLDIPIVIHGGNSPGYPIKNANPVYVDEVAHDFPSLKICIAHLGWPWHDLAASIAWNRPNVYLDFNAIRFKYISQGVITLMNTAIQDKILFSHDHPVVNTKKLLREFEELPLTPEVKRKIQEENPRRFLGI